MVALLAAFLFASLNSTLAALVWASTSDSSLLPSDKVVWEQAPAGGRLNLTPLPGQGGTVVVKLFTVNGTNVVALALATDLTPPPANTPPTISRIADQVLPKNSVPVIYSFTVGDAETVPERLFVRVSSSNPSVVAPNGMAAGFAGATRSLLVVPAREQTGSTVLTLEVTDGELTNSSSFTLTVISPNQPPVVSAGKNQFITWPNVAVLAGSATDDGLPDTNQPLTFRWSQVSGPGLVSFDNAAAANTVARFERAGVHQLRLTASDGALSASGDVTITVNRVETIVPVRVTAGDVRPPLEVISERDLLPTTSLRLAISQGVQPADLVISSVASGSVVCTFEVPEEGDYALWGRILPLVNGRGSFFYAIDGQTPQILGVEQAMSSGPWLWVRPLTAPAGQGLTAVTHRLAAGAHTLTVRVREPWTGLSQILLSSDHELVPSEAAPVLGVALPGALTNVLVKLTVDVGFSLLANPLERGENKVSEILSLLPDTARLMELDETSGLYTFNTFAAGRWSLPEMTLPPGEGAYFFNPQSVPLNLVLAGQPPAPSAPQPLGTGLHLLGPTAFRSGPISQVTHIEWRAGDKVYKHGPGGFSIYTYLGNGWDQEPVLALGEGFFLSRSAH